MKNRLERSWRCRELLLSQGGSEIFSRRGEDPISIRQGARSMGKTKKDVTWCKVLDAIGVQRDEGHMRTRSSSVAVMSESDGPQNTRRKDRRGGGCRERAGR